MKNNSKGFYVKAFVSALAVFLVFYFAFGFVFTAYAPTLQAKIDAAREAALSSAAGGEEMTLMEDVEAVAGVSEIYSTSAGNYVIKVKAQGLEGPVTLIVGVSGEGNVSGIVVDSHSETPDVGGLALKDDYLANYIGVDSTEGIDAYTGATYTSAAIKECVDKALLQYQVINGLDYDGPVELTEEELLAQALTTYLGEGYVKADTELASLAGQSVDVTEVYTSDAGYGIVVEGEGHNGLIRIMFYLDNDGVVRKIVPIVQNESLDHGAKVFTESALYFYEGYSEFAYFDDGSGAKTMDSFSGATQTSMKLFQMLITAADQYKLMNAAPEA